MCEYEEQFVLQIKQQHFIRLKARKMLLQRIQNPEKYKKDIMPKTNT